MRYTEVWYKRLLDHVFPPGRFTFLETGPLSAIASWLSKWHSGASVELERVDDRQNDLMEGFYPDAATELLTEWENNLGLPHTGTISERQQRIVSKLTYSGGSSKQYFIALAASLGYAITIETFEPFWIGHRSINTPLYSENWMTSWWVYVPAAGLTLIETTFNAIMPADTRVAYFAV